MAIVMYNDVLCESVCCVSIYSPLSPIDASSVVSVLHSLCIPSTAQIKYKDMLGKGTAIWDLPEVKRVRENQKHISSVVELETRAARAHNC